MTEWVYPNNKTFGDLSYEDKLKPGMLLEVSDGDHHRKRQVLVGDINVMGGVCDDCTLFSLESQVIRYKQVWP